MTVIKLDSAISAAVKGALEELADEMWDRLGAHYVGTVEFKVAERTEADHLEDKEPSAKLRITRLEVARTTEQGDQVMALHKQLYADRTRTGTLDEFSEHIADEQRVPRPRDDDREPLAIEGADEDVIEAEVVGSPS